MPFALRLLYVVCMRKILRTWKPLSLRIVFWLGPEKQVLPFTREWQLRQGQIQSRAGSQTRKYGTNPISWPVQPDTPAAISSVPVFAFQAMLCMGHPAAVFWNVPTASRLTERLLKRQYRRQKEIALWTSMHWLKELKKLSPVSPL